MRYFLVASIVSLSCSLVLSQVDISNPGLGDVVVDTTFSDVPTGNANSQGFFDIFSGNPGRAALYSLLIPGGGQFYNRRYWKVPLAMAVDGYVIYNLYFNISNFNDWNDALIAFNNEEISAYRGFTAASQIKTQRDVYRRGKEFGILIAAGGHLLTIVEAFVDRHLMEFDISDDLTIGSAYGQSSQSFAFGVFYNL